MNIPAKLKTALRNPEFSSQNLIKRLVGEGTGILSNIVPFASPGNIAMIHMGRCGSSVLGNLLNQNPDVFWDGEIFERFFSAYEKSGKRLLEEGHKFQEDPIALLKRKMRCSGNKFYGFEIKFFHMNFFNTDLQHFIENLKNIGFTHFLILERKNYLKKIVSSLIAHDTGEYHIASGIKPRKKKVYMDTDNIRIDRTEKPLLAFLEDYRQNYVDVLKLLDGERVLRLAYEEDIADNPCTAYNKVSGFCNLAPKKISIKYARTNPFRLEEMISNFEQVKNTLQETDFEWMAQ